MGEAGHGVERAAGKRSRRQLIAGTTGALGALAAAAVKAAPAQATQGSAVIEGADNTGATSRTAVFTTGNNEFGILADPNTSGNGSVGVYGHGQDVGVIGDSGSSVGVRGQTVSGHGVDGLASDNVTGIGVFGGGALAGVWGESIVGPGVHGVSTASGVAGVSGIGETGVRGNGQSTGVLGDSISGNGIGVSGVATRDGTGVSGSSGTGVGVLAQSTSGLGVQSQGGAVGVHAGSARGIAVRAVTSTGVALLAEGPAHFLGPCIFSRSAVVSIRHPHTSATVTMPGRLISESLALAVLQNSIPGVWVVSAVPDPRTGKVTVNLNKAPTRTAKVGVFVAN